MNIKRKLLPLAMAMLLTSCGADDVTGVYKFQLGADKGTHMGLSMELKSTDYQADPTKGKGFDLIFDMKGMTGDDPDSTATNFDDSYFKMSGYYTVNGERLNLGTTILDDFFGEGTIDIPSELVEKILFATVGNNKVNVVIPVSLDDLIFQLYWYGFRVDVSNFTFTAINAHDVGTHPTKENVTAIVNYEKGLGETDNPFESFRDYHTLSMGLSK